MPLLFSYGSLQRVEVQLATFGRALGGISDEIVGWRLVPASIEGSPHANVLRAPDASRVAGTAFEVSDAELVSADVYERSDGYVRVAARLLSGRHTWLYVDGLSVADPDG